MPKLKVDRTILEAALVGLGHKMGEVTQRLPRSNGCSVEALALLRRPKAPEEP
jgi:hypothetical protein